MQGRLKKSDSLDSRQFLIAIKRLANSFNYGNDRSPFLGTGTDYVQSRGYQPGDPVKAIDWRVTGRTGKFHVKEYEAPRQFPCYLLVDTSASMTVSSSREHSKYSVAVHIAGGLALACLDRVSPVGVLGVGGRPLRLEPSLSRDQVYQWLYDLRSFRYDEATGIRKAVADLGARLSSTSLVILLSDLHEPGALHSLKGLAQQHEVVAVQVQDPAEQGVRGIGFVRAQEAETGRDFVTHGRTEWQAQDALEDELKKSGIDHILVRTDQPFAHRLRHFFQSRNVLGRGAR